jgi:hypothetical protein
MLLLLHGRGSAASAAALAGPGWTSRASFDRCCCCRLLAAADALSSPPDPPSFFYAQTSPRPPPPTHQHTNTVILRAVGGEVGSASTLAPKVGPLGLVRRRCDLKTFIMPACVRVRRGGGLRWMAFGATTPRSIAFVVVEGAVCIYHSHPTQTMTDKNPTHLLLQHKTTVAQEDW